MHILLDSTDLFIRYCHLYEFVSSIQLILDLLSKLLVHIDFFPEGLENTPFKF